MAGCNCAQCCFCKGYIVNKSRYRVTIDKVDEKGQIICRVKRHRNVCNDCMGDIQKTIDSLDQSRRCDNGQKSGN